jgi:hypothetical protein
MRITNLILCILLLSGCGRQQIKEQSEQVKIETLKPDATDIRVECIQKDTTTRMGTTIHYLYHDKKFQISWGDNTYNRIYDSLYSCYYDKDYGLWDFVPKLNYETKNHLIFSNIQWTSSGGNPAPLEFYAIVCPKNKNDSIFEKEFFINCDGDYLIYGDPKNENIHLLNLETTKSQTVLLKPKPYLSRSPTLSIREAEIKEKSFYIKYESLDKNDQIISIEKTFKIEI